MESLGYFVANIVAGVITFPILVIMRVIIQIIHIIKGEDPLS